MVQTKRSAIHNVRVESITRLDPPSAYWRRYPLPDAMREQVAGHRRQIEEILSSVDRRMLMIVGPCSIHDTDAGVDYARRLSSLASEVSERILVAMRVYFEKPRTTVGWKGLINDPNLNGTYDVHGGMARARGVPAGGVRPGPAGGDGVPGVVHAAVPGRYHLVGGDRREDDGEPAAQADGKRPEHADRLQKRHGRERRHSAGRDRCGDE